LDARSTVRLRTKCRISKRYEPSHAERRPDVLPFSDLRPHLRRSSRQGRRCKDQKAR